MITPSTRVCQGGNITLQCEVTLGNTALQGQWKRNSQAISIANATLNHFIYISFTQANFLTIINIGPNDNNTEYNCASGDVNESIFLNVEGMYMHTLTLYMSFWLYCKYGCYVAHSQMLWLYFRLKEKIHLSWWKTLTRHWVTCGSKPGVERIFPSLALFCFMLFV